MYTVVERRKTNPDTIQQTAERAGRELFPQMQASDGFVGFYVVNDEAQGEHVVIMVWQTKAQAEAFLAAEQDWMKVPGEMGQELLTTNTGDTIVDLSPS
jgi:heme-degrading monooxygenase HmoA